MLSLISTVFFEREVVKKIEKTIEKIPGLGPLIEKVMDSISGLYFPNELHDHF